MTEEITINRNADNLALNAFKVLRECFLVWAAACAITIIASIDGWAIIASFFIGFVVTSIFFLIPGVMAIAALRGGTQYKHKATLTALAGIGLFLITLLLYTL